MKKNTAPYLAPGHSACVGCGAALAMKLVLEALGENIILVIPACCWTIIEGANLCSCLPKTPVIHTAFETTAVVATGIKTGLEVQGQNEIDVVGWAGDGGTFDIGIQALSSAAEKNVDIMYFCYDNEAYMNTGVQRSGATPCGARTTTTPGGNILWKKNMPEIVAAHRVPYVATVSLAWPEDLQEKVAKARTIKGFRYIQICSPCPAGWKYEPRYAIKLARLAVETGIYPVYEIIDGKIIFKAMKPKPGAKLKPFEEYLKLQGRFRHLKEANIEEIQKRVVEERITLLKKAGLESPDFSYLLLD